MHMQIAGKTRWTAPSKHTLVHLYSDDGSRFTAPIIHGEAGLDDLGQPVRTSRPAARSHLTGRH